MLGTLRVTFAPALLAILAFTATPPVETVALTPPSDIANALAVPVVAPLPQIVASSVAEWGAETPQVTILPPPPVRTTPRIQRDYGPAPALSGAILTIASEYLGVMYVRGGASPSGFDCSGFVQYVYAQNGISIPRTVSGIRNAGTVTDSPQPGDIVVFAHHVGLWVAPGWLVDSGRTGLPVQERPIWTSAYVVIHVG
jgi:cell wall-associated NlpC family hydrolase